MLNKRSETIRILHLLFIEKRQKCNTYCRKYTSISIMHCKRPLMIARTYVNCPPSLILRVSQRGPCSLVPFQNCPMFPCSHTFSECFRTVIFRILFPCSQKSANVPLFPSIFCQCSLVPQNPWETLNFGDGSFWYIARANEA